MHNGTHDSFDLEAGIIPCISNLLFPSEYHFECINEKVPITLLDAIFRLLNIKSRFRD